MTSKNQLVDIDDPRYRTTPLQQVAASCTGAVITSLFVTPLDVVKIRLQAQQKAMLSSRCFLYCNGLMDHICGCYPDAKTRQWYSRPSHFNGTIDALVKITKSEGISSLWSGLSPTLVLAVPATIVYFVTYEQLRLKLKDNYNRTSMNSYEQPYWIPLVSGATARVISATVVSPLELIRTKMQSKKLSYLEIGEALKLLVKQDGIIGLWKGVFPTLLRDVPFSALYWMNYEFIKSYGPGVPSFSFSFLAGALAGGFAAVITLPFDVVKTHQQIELGEQFFGDERKRPQTTSEIIKKLYYQYGVRGLFTGIVPRVVKVAPACAIMIATFEYGKIQFSRLEQEFISDSASIASASVDSTSSIDISSGDSDSSVDSFNKYKSGNNVHSFDNQNVMSDNSTSTKVKDAFGARDTLGAGLYGEINVKPPKRDVL